MTLTEAWTSHLLGLNLGRDCGRLIRLSFPKFLSGFSDIVKSLVALLPALRIHAMDGFVTQIPPRTENEERPWGSPPLTIKVEENPIPNEREDIARPQGYRT